MKGENMSSDCSECKDYHTDPEGIHQDYCGNLGVIKNEDEKKRYSKMCQRI